MDVQRVEILHDKGFCCRCQLMEFLHVHWILPSLTTLKVRYSLDYQQEVKVIQVKFGSIIR